MFSFLEKYKLLFKYQYAFRAGYSTALALMEMTDYLKKELNLGNYIATLFIDLKKAFDTVDHSILLYKMKHYGIRGHANSFFQSYLNNRKQFVHCNDVNSDTNEITCGVPQGSILGPTLFLLYVNDMFRCVDVDSLRLFADDTICMTPGKNLNQIMSKMKNNLTNLKIWFDSNKLTLNLTKTFYSIFHSKSKRLQSCE